MAHKGKTWRLCFRRDFNVNINTYQGGLADAYLVQLSTGTFGTAAAWNGVRFVLSGATVVSPSAGELVWTSPNVHNGSAGMELAIRLLPPAFHPLARARLFDAHDNLLVEWAPHADTLRTSTFEFGAGARIISNDPIRFTPTTNVERSSIVPRHYDQE